MACANSDVDDFVTCGVCFNEYDTEEKKPKFLQCSHTICLKCLKQICRDGSITCPFCRNTFVKADVSTVPNNSYALHILKLNEKKVEEPSKTMAPPMVVGWCFTCNGAEKPNCFPFGHSTVKMSADTIRNLDALLNLKEELLKMKDEKTEKLAKAIEKRKKVQEKLSDIMKSIQSVGDRVKTIQDENNLKLTEMVSILERKESKKPEDGKNDLLLSELMDLVDDSSPDDTAETLRLKMTKSAELCDQRLSEATALESKFDVQEAIKIIIQLFDDKDCPIATGKWLKNGFRLQPDSSPLINSQTRQELILINYVITSFLRKQNVSLENNKTAIVASTPLNNMFPTEKFVLGQSSLFILRLFRSNIQTGEVHIRPGLSFHPEFIQKLGEFCFKSPKLFCNSIDKAVPNVFVSCTMAHPQFQPNVASMLGSNQNIAAAKADEVDEVGVISIKNSAGKTPALVSWSFIFPLEDFRSPKFKLQTKTKKVNELFGRVIHRQMMEPVKKLSTLLNAERKNWTATLESI